MQMWATCSARANRKRSLSITIEPKGRAHSVAFCVGISAAPADRKIRLLGNRRQQTAATTITLEVSSEFPLRVSQFVYDL